MNKLYEELLPRLSFPGGDYGVTAGGSTGPWYNGAAGQTGTMGDTGPLGTAIDTRGFDKALVIVDHKGSTGASQAATYDAFVSDENWISASGTTGPIGGFEIATAVADSTIQKVGELDCSKFSGRYLWIRQSITGLGETNVSVSVVLGKADKLPTGTTLTDEA